MSQIGQVVLINFDQTQALVAIWSTALTHEDFPEPRVPVSKTLLARLPVNKLQGIGTIRSFWSSILFRLLA